jgi:hypothetical protein
VTQDVMRGNCTMSIGIALLVSAGPVTIHLFSHALQELSISPDVPASSAADESRANAYRIPWQLSAVAHPRNAAASLPRWSRCSLFHHIPSFVQHATVTDRDTSVAEPVPACRSPRRRKPATPCNWIRVSQRRSVDANVALK